MNDDIKNKKTPPRLANRFLRWYCRPELLDEVAGDLYELFQRRVVDKGIWKAKALYWLNVLMFLHPDYIRKREYSYPVNHIAMYKHYFTIALRTMKRQKGYTLINILGLSVGIAAFLLIVRWVQDELSFDRFHTKADRIYRVSSQVTTDTETFSQAVTSPPVALETQRYFPEVENAVRLDMNDAIVELDKEKWKEDRILLTDLSFFEIFDFHLLRGDVRTALNAPYQIILSETTARKYFGDSDPMGQTLRIYAYDPGGNGADYKVVGIIEDCPASSHFQYDLLISFKTYETYNPDRLGWFNNGLYTYLLLREGASPQALEAKLPQFLELFMGEGMKQYQTFHTYTLQPLKDIYLHSELRSEIGATGSVGYIILFLTIGVFILVLACINYINLATALAIQKTKEVGVRKVMGALRKQLVGQYLVESVCVALIALGVALLMIEGIKPFFYTVTGKFNLSLLGGNVLYFLIPLAILIGIVSGIFPALLLSRALPATVLKGQFHPKRSGDTLRKGLVMFQFAISLTLICGLLIVHEQMQYIRQKDLGYDKDRLLILRENGSQEVKDHFEAFKNDLLQQPLIQSVGCSNSMIGGGLGNSLATTEDNKGNPVSSSINKLHVDADFTTTYGITFLAGRNFSGEIASDATEAFIVNEAAVRAFGWPDAESAIGKKFNQNGEEGHIIGVVQNFHYNSLFHVVEPLFLALGDRYYSRITIRYRPADLNQVLSVVGQSWKRHFPNSLMDYSFQDESLESQYKAEQRFSQIGSTFTALSMLIACLGLFGLTSFTTRQRTKEIGIRKVLGASTTQILLLLSREFIKLVLVALLLAVPLACLGMEAWLEDFAYRITIGVWPFIIAGGSTLLVVWLTVSYQSVKAASANPVASLRSE